MAFHHASLPGRDDNISLASALSESSASFFRSDFPQVLKIAVNCGQITLLLLLIQLHFGQRGSWWSDTPAWSIYVFCNCGSVKKKPFFPESVSNFQVSFCFFFFSYSTVVLLQNPFLWKLQGNFKCDSCSYFAFSLPSIFPNISKC